MSTEVIVSTLRGLDGALENYPFTARILALAIFFLSGFFEAAILKQKVWACATCFLGLGALTAGIVYPLTAVRISFGVTVFVSGVVLLILYYKRQAPRAMGKT